MIAGLHSCVRRWVELHAAGRTAHANDDHAKALPEIGADDGGAGQRAVGAHLYLFHRQLQKL